LQHPNSQHLRTSQPRVAARSASIRAARAWEDFAQHLPPLQPTRLQAPSEHSRKDYPPIRRRHPSEVRASQALQHVPPPASHHAPANAGAVRAVLCVDRAFPRGRQPPPTSSTEEILRRAPKMAAKPSAKSGRARSGAGPTGRPAGRVVRATDGQGKGQGQGEEERPGETAESKASKTGGGETSRGSRCCTPEFANMLEPD